MGLQTSIGYAASAKEVVLFDQAVLVDSPTPQVIEGSASIGKFQHVTLFGHISKPNANAFSLAVACWFVLGPGADPGGGPSVLAFKGTLQSGDGAFPVGFTYDAPPNAPVAGETLVCRTDPCSGACASTVTLKAVFTK